MYTKERVDEIVRNVMFAFLSWLETVDASFTDVDMDLLTIMTSALYYGEWDILTGDKQDYKRLIASCCIEKKDMDSETFGGLKK